MKTFSLKCRKNTKSKNARRTRVNIGRTMLLLKCEVWDSKKKQDSSKKESSGLLSKLGIKTP